jgi:threonine synthase
VIHEYRDRLPVVGDAPVVTLREGGTPLVLAEALSSETNCNVYLKVEGDNPTGSFKDRGMTVAISRALADDAKAVICASTGNTSASAAAYAAKAGLRCVVVIPSGKIAAGKLAQAVVHGATLLQVEGAFDDCLDVARGLAERFPVVLVNSVNRVRLQGQKTAAFEVVDALGDAPEIHALPVGNAGNVSAYWAGYLEYAADGVATRRPQMWGFQASGAAPLVLGRRIPDPETLATAIRVGNPASWQLALDAREQSMGRFAAVSDDEILAAQRFLAEREGIFAEPASAAGVAGLLSAAAVGELHRGASVVVTVTGHGLKDVDTALLGRRISADVVAPSVDAAAQALGLA